MTSGLVWSYSRGWVGAGTSLLCGACFGRSLERNRLSKMRQLLQIPVHVIRENYCMYVKLRFAAALPIIDVHEYKYGSGYGNPTGSGGQSSVGKWLRAKVESQELTEPTFTHQADWKCTVPLMRDLIKFPGK